MKQYLLFLVLFSISIHVSSQNLDSIYKEASLIKNDSLKLIALNKVAFKYIFSNTEKAAKIIEEGQRLAINKKENYALTILTNTKGIYMDVTGKSDSARIYFERALNLSQNYGYEEITSNCINNLGMVNWNIGAYEEALEYFFKSLKLYETNDRLKNTATSLNNIGLIYQEMGLNNKALDYHRRALKIREQFDLINDQINSHNNIGINLKDLGQLSEAESSYKKGIKLAKSQNNLLEYYKLLENLANVYNLQNRTDLALKTYLECSNKLDVYSGEERGLFSIYTNITALFNKMNNPQKALNYIKKGVNLITRYPELKNTAAEFYLNSAETNYMLDNFDKARALRDRFVTLRDSVFSDRNAKAIADLDVKYETEKKERQILKQRALIAERDLVIQRRNYQIYSVLGLAAVLGVLGYLFYNQQKLKNIQLEKENELRKAFAQIEVQNKLQEQRLRISRDLHDNIGAQLTFIISSLDNLKYGFELPDKLDEKLTTISSFTNNTIAELRDTIWAMNKDEIGFEDLQIRISNFINKADLASQDITFNFTVNDEVSRHRTFTSVEGMNIYRIIQEGINNALKHSEASAITVSVKTKGKQLHILIEDNGKGFDINNSEFSNGINNIKKRAKEIDANITIDTKADSGTKLYLIC